ncbi:ribosome biogenesis GTPase Der [Gemmatimonadota bacterium]
MSTPTVAIIGRPNVGKSTLFNRIVGGRRAIVDDQSGVTRDRNFAPASWGGRDFWLVDTGGWDAASDDVLTKAIREQIEAAIAESDAIIFVVDSQVGVHPADLEVAQLLRPHRDRVLLAANKVDELPDNSSALVFYELGLGDPLAVSASIGKASGDLLDELLSLLPGAAEDAGIEDTVHVAVVGRPNVGKSSIMNRLLGKERSVVAPEAGTTRDAVDSPLRYHGRRLNFIDTAGLRKRSKVEDDIEFYSALRTRRAIDRADVCVLVVDATDGVNTQDLRIARMAWDAGTGLIVAVNKWDLIEEKDTTTAIHGQRLVEERVPFLKAVPFVYESAKTGLRVRKVLDLILEIAEARGLRVATAEVNKVLGALVDRTQPPQKPGAEVKLLYASQVGTEPPVFAIVSNRPNMIVESYRRYLQNGFRDAWGFKGTPMRLKFRRKRGR